jgi:hypothetical protein
VGLAAVGWWVAVSLVDDGYYIGLTDDEGKLLVRGLQSFASDPL